LDSFCKLGDAAKIRGTERLLNNRCDQEPRLPVAWLRQLLRRAPISPVEADAEHQTDRRRNYAEDSDDPSQRH